MSKKTVRRGSGDYAQFGNNQMLAADPARGDLRLFLVGPLGQEITGVITTPDRRTIFVNIQHPGATTSPTDFAAGKLTGTWPNQGRYPRSATVVITREDGGTIGTQGGTSGRRRRTGFCFALAVGGDWVIPPPPLTPVGFGRFA